MFQSLLLQEIAVMYIFIQAHKYLKSLYCPARYLLKTLPHQFYAINAYLHTGCYLYILSLKD